MRQLKMLILSAVLIMSQVFCLAMPSVYAVEADPVEEAVIEELAVDDNTSEPAVEIHSNEALVVNLDTDEVLFSKNTKDGPVEIASLTKVMTYILTVENIDDLENTMIVVPEGMKQEIIAQNGSNAGLEDKYEYSALDLLYGLMLPSGCDAADVLALHIGGGDYNKFIDMMNEKAKELGMEHTKFYTASGLTTDTGAYNESTEQDLYKMAKYAFDLPYFQKIIGTEWYEVVGTQEEKVDSNMVQNTNYMIGDFNGAEYYYLYSLGGKTGNTPGAGRCLISYAKKGDLSVAAITLGVPGEHSNYHLEDHRILFDYVFETFTDNITVEIGSLYKSVEIGKKIKLTPVTSEETVVTWASSDESVATVNEFGVVTGHKLGQVEITATTATGNMDHAYVSVGFYNAIDVKYSAGPSDENGILGYGPIDWSVVKDYGIDCAIIRAGYALNNQPDSDPYFVTNIEGASANGLNIMISFDGYATNAEYAEAEAEYLVNYLQTSIPEYVDDITLPIVYNLYPSGISNAETLKTIMLAFNAKMNSYGYNVVVELGRTLLKSMDLEPITEAGIELYVIYRPYLPDYRQRMDVPTADGIYDASIWQYRTDAYLGGKGIGPKTTMSAIYMDYLDINTTHEKFDEEMYPEKPVISVEDDYVYTGADIKAMVTGFDPETMDIAGNVGKNAGEYTITVIPKIMWKDGSKDAVIATWTIEKAVPTFEIPQLKAKAGTVLKYIELPENFYWQNEKAVVRRNAENKFMATYIPDDTDNYQTVEVELVVEVTNNPFKPNNKPSIPNIPSFENVVKRINKVMDMIERIVVKFFWTK